MNDEVWIAMKNLLLATENNSSAIEALASGNRSNTYYLEALVQTQVVLFQLLIKELNVSPEVMVAHLHALAEHENTPTNVRSLLVLHRDACQSIVGDEAPKAKKRPDWYKGIVSGLEEGDASRAQRGSEE